MSFFEESRDFRDCAPSKGWSTSEVSRRNTDRFIKDTVRNAPKVKNTRRTTLNRSKFDQDMHSDVRHFHNELKQQLYAESLKLQNMSRVKFPRLLELSCGRGGDIHKWKKTGFKSISAYDISIEAITEAKKRWKNIDKNDMRAKFSVADLADNDAVQKISGTYNVVSMQFAIHYLADPRTKALHNIFKAINNWLAPGGVFICTFPDGDHIGSLIKDGEFDNDFLRIKEDTETGMIQFFADFGSSGSYFEAFGDSKEWTISPKTLYKLAHEFSLEVVSSKSFLESPCLDNWPLLLDEKEFSGCFRTLILRKSPMSSWFPHRMGINFNALQIDNIGKYSITRPYDAQALHKTIQHYTGSPVASCVDATACVGGDTIYLSDYCKTTTAFENDHVRYEMLQNNLKWYGKPHVQCVYGSFMLSSDITADLLYMDPPWGGVNYKDEVKKDLFIDNVNIVELIPELLTRFKTIALKVPINYNFPEDALAKNIHQVSKNVLVWILQNA